MSEPFYITTPIYYVNDVPHVGHAYTTIAADTIARYWRARGRETFFLTGTDEHGQKIQDTAEARGLVPQALADEVVQRFKASWDKLDISHDDFIRTTQDRHKQFVTELWKRMETAGDIYLGAFEGFYCVACENYYPDNQLLPGNKCPTHKTKASWLAEPSYFFRMSKYQDALLAHIDANPDFIQPANYRNEVISFVRGGLRDLSVSRTTFEWGIPVPERIDTDHNTEPNAEPKDRAKHIIYVWVDALSNYISALGDLDSERTKKFWPANCHLIGKDILRFHAVYWPTFLLSAGLPLPRSIRVHGWWTVRGEKISKSMPATRVDPNMLANDIGSDALRYFLLREVPLGLDGDFSYESLLGRYNSELANDLGNLLGRITSMTCKYRNGDIPAYIKDLASSPPAADLVEILHKTIQVTTEEFANYAPSRALDAIWALVRAGNRYVGESEPWKMAKNEACTEALDHVLRSVLEVLACVAQLMAPVMPSKATELLTRLGLDKEEAENLAKKWPIADDFGTWLDGAGRVEAGGLFPRIEPPRAKELLDKWIPDDAKIESQSPETETETEKNTAKKNKPGATAPLVAFDDFKRFDFRVATVIAAEAIAKTKKLLAIKLDVGPLGERSVVAGIAEAYNPADLIGKTVIFLANLAPATIRGVRSEGMILAAGDRSIVGLSTLDCDAAPGTIVR